MTTAQPAAQISPDPFMEQLAQRVMKKIWGDAPVTPTAKDISMFRALLSRQATEEGIAKLSYIATWIETNESRLFALLATSRTPEHA
jgi:hypothetical protein